MYEEGKMVESKSENHIGQANLERNWHFHKQMGRFNDSY